MICVIFIVGFILGYEGFRTCGDLSSVNQLLLAGIFVKLKQSKLY